MNDTDGSKAGGFALLVAWADGTHSLECYSSDFEWVSRQVASMRRFWRIWPTRAEDIRVIAVSEDEWQRHRKAGRCRELGCLPTPQPIREPAAPPIRAGFALREEWMAGHTFAWFIDDRTIARSAARRRFWRWKLAKLVGVVSPVGLTLVPLTYATYLAHHEDREPCARPQCRSVPSAIWHDVDGPRIREL